MSDDYQPTRRMGSGEFQQPQQPQQPQPNPAYPPQQPYAPPPGHVPPPVNPGAGYPQAKTQILRRSQGPLSLAWVVIVGGPYEGQSFRLNPDGNTIGRDTTCHIPLDDPSTTRLHAKIWQTENDEGQKQFVIQDLASENGTFLNGEEIIKAALSDDDYITIGQTDLVFKEIIPKKK